MSASLLSPQNRRAHPSLDASCWERQLGWGSAGRGGSGRQCPVLAAQAGMCFQEALAKLHLSLAALGLPVERLLPAECGGFQTVDVPDLGGGAAPKGRSQMEISRHSWSPYSTRICAPSLMESSPNSPPRKALSHPGSRLRELMPSPRPTARAPELGLEPGSALFHTERS